ncbi:hypothetical protein ILUMI_04499 [Ignelater luminosus]|uniref:Ig-like domain-containing protein n=1 Tax=Ignelater luminosus TaxID=2038154 RepID=A0A8K0DE85_IGNLU|nr:hypothetical protein ILUMI_04499 [Ignelater luminosus]
MLKNVLKMSRWFLLFITINLITTATCRLNLHVVGSDGFNGAFLVTGTFEAVIGSNLTLTCSVTSTEGAGSHGDPELVWGKRSRLLRFKNETDLVKLAQQGYPYLYDFHNDKLSYNKNTAILKFTPVKSSDQGLYFCMYLKYMLFEVIHIKVTEKKSNIFGSYSSCRKDKFTCVASGHCINLHYKCDGREDCLDGSDEDPSICDGDPCRGKIHCGDGRCIPTTWCCNKLTDDNCTVAVRPSCCPTLIDREYIHILILIFSM